MKQFSKDTIWQSLTCDEIIPLWRERKFKLPGWVYEAIVAMVQVLMHRDGNYHCQTPAGLRYDSREQKCALIAAVLSGYAPEENGKTGIQPTGGASDEPGPGKRITWDAGFSHRS